MRRDGANGHQVTLFTKPGCHLCDGVRAVLERITTELDVPLEEVDISTDPELYARWGELIPVTLIDGKEHAHWRVSEDRLRRELSR